MSERPSSPAVSVIVPAYNAADTLAACLDALLAQTLPALEILLIDDGSRDDTPAIAARYAARDPRIRFHCLESNQGVSAARNAGLRLARGDFIGFCDADDLPDPRLYERLLTAAREADAEVAFCAVRKRFSGGEATVPLPWPDGTVFDTGGIRGDLIPQMISLPRDGEALPVSGYTPRNLFARSLLRDHFFREDLHYAEDLLFIVQALLRARRAAVVGEALYTYVFRPGSKTKSYVPGLAAQYEACHQALDQAFAREGLSNALVPRMRIRRRRAALALCCNLCLPGTPFSLIQRIRQIHAFEREETTRALFSALPLRALPLKLRLKYACMKFGWALPLALFYSYFYRSA